MSTHHGLTRRIHQLEKQSGADEKYLTIPLGEPGHSLRLPRTFVEFLASRQVERRADGRSFNLTDQQWVEC